MVLGPIQGIFYREPAGDVESARSARIMKKIRDSWAIANIEEEKGKNERKTALGDPRLDDGKSISSADARSVSEVDAGTGQMPLKVEGGDGISLIRRAKGKQYGVAATEGFRKTPSDEELPEFV